MKRFILLLSALSILSCSCFAYSAYVIHRTNMTIPNAITSSQATFLALGYPPGNAQTASALGYPPGNAQTASALGYPPGNAQTASALGYPPGNLQTASALGYPPGNLQTASALGYPPGNLQTASALGYPPGNLQTASALGYPPGNAQTASALGYPPGNAQTASALGYPPGNLPTGHGCQANKYNDEPEIFVGTDPPPGGIAGLGGKIRVWVNDEGAPKIAPGEMVDPNTGLITPGNRTALDGRGKGVFLWEPALYITPLTSANQNGPFSGDAENGGKPYFPSQIKGDYNSNVNSDKGRGLKGPPVDGDYTKFENGPQGGGGEGKHTGGGLSEQFTAEYIWNINALALPPGAYHVEMVIHDGDDNLGMDCVAMKI